MGRYFLKGAAGIALIFLAGIGLVELAIRDATPTTDPVAPAVPTQVEQGRGSPVGALAADPAPAQPTWSAPPRRHPSVPKALSVSRRVQLRSFRGDLAAGLGELRGRVAHCELAGVALYLSLESEQGAVRVVDVEPAALGAAAEAALGCARSALAGQVLSVANADPGLRWRLPFSTASTPQQDVEERAATGPHSSSEVISPSPPALPGERVGEGAVHREMLVARQVGASGRPHDLGEEPRSHLVLEPKR